MQREKLRSFWGKMNYACGKKKGGSPTSIQVEGEHGMITEHNTQDSVQNAIWNNIHLNRFYLAEAAPICNGLLRGDFGYSATTITAQKVLDGTYIYPVDFDQATRELCEECARIRLTVPIESIRTVINTQEWANHWSKANQDTSSSWSGRHFGCYKAARHSKYVSHFHALLASLTMHHGIVLDRWACGLSVMLQKILGCSLVTKLRSILLMEADFNCANKVVFGVRMMENVRKYKLMPSEIYSERGRMADDGTLAKVIMYDVVRQTRLPAGIASVDADNCFDRIAHPIASMVFQALGVPLTATTTMLKTIQDMKFFLRTGYGDSTNCANSRIEVRTQGLCQGNGAAPAGWAVVNITIVSAHKKKGHGAYFLCPITKLTSHVVGVIFVDDTDLMHFRMDRNEDEVEVAYNLQESITNWGKLLITSGGALKPIKCFYYIISFEWNRDGTWKYASNDINEDGEENNDLRITIPLSDGSTSYIKHLRVHEATKTLGLMTCPSGCNTAAISAMQEKSVSWATTVKEGKLSRRNVWFMMEVQFWPRVAYGLCSVTASFDALEECLMKPYLQIQQQGGVCKSARRGLRQLDRGFYGIGCPNPAIECFIAQISKLLTHCGSQSNLGIAMQTSIELLIIELGRSAQPFREDYSSYQHWVTNSWLKSVWEKADRLKVEIKLGRLPLLPPRGVNDYWLMVEMAKICTPDELIRLNRVRLHQQVMFGSDIMDSSGRSLEKKYLWKRPPDESWSTLHFSQERPPNRDFVLWRKTLPQLRGQGRLHLGSHESVGHKIWNWRFDEDNSTLIHQQDDNTDNIYQLSNARGLTTRANAWGLVRVNQARTSVGKLCTVEKIGVHDNYKIIAYAPPPTQRPSAQSLREVLKEWGHEWMWADLRLTGDDTWIASAINNNSLVAVTDGSYMNKLYPHMNSCAFILECSKGRGRITGAFSEQAMAACAYRGELLGLLAIHLILLSVHKLSPALTGSVQIYSDCLGALNQVKNLPHDRIPSKCKHSDILKTIMINCHNLTFDQIYLHVEAHQDDTASFEKLTRPSQLNCACDFAAKRVLLQLTPGELPKQECLPLESVSIWAGREKITTDTASRLRFYAHKQMAREEFHNAKILFRDQFDKVDWEMVHKALTNVPRMFQIFICKQVFNIAGTNGWLARFDKTNNTSPLCPSCLQVMETAEHTLHCGHAGRVEVMTGTIKLLDSWMKTNNTDPKLRECIYFFASGRGKRSMRDICREHNYDERYTRMAQAQDEIGWRRFMEGMICLELRHLQQAHVIDNGLFKTGKRWAEELIIKLIEITHGQWLYRNIQVHDKVTGLKATLHKEDIQNQIETQQAIGFKGLLEEDAFLAECNLGDLEVTSGRNEIYWLLAIKAAREAMRIEEQDRIGVADGIT